MPNRINIGWVHINTGMSMTRTRPDARRLYLGSLAPREDNASEEPDHWVVLPYAVGSLQAYAQRHASKPEQYSFLPPIFKRIPIEEAVEQLSGADIVGFSTYVWNIRLSLSIAKRIKDLQPETLIVFGGPQVPDKADNFLREHPFVDIVCHEEGERTFVAVLEKCQSRDWRAIPSISYIDNGAYVSHPQAPRMKDLSNLPSPYLEGVFDPLMQANPQIEWMAIWETNRGCPYTCTFCDWGSIASKVCKFDLERVFRELEWMALHKIEYVYCCDANFGIFPRDMEIARYAAELRKKFDYPKTLILESAKGAAKTVEGSYGIHKLLREAGFSGSVSFSLQSLDEHTLKNIKRKNPSLTSFQELQQRLRCDKIDTYTELILGLPGETYETFTHGISQVIKNGEHNHLYIYNCSILPNAEMGDLSYQSAFEMQTVSQRIVAAHDNLTDLEQVVPEYMEIVIATKSMPKREWVKAKAFCWMTDLLYFDRLMCIPFVLANKIYSQSYRELIELFTTADRRYYPLLAEIQATFVDKAQQIHQGDPEFNPSNDWLGIWWPMDQTVLIRLVTEGKLDRFYDESERIIKHYLQIKTDAQPSLIHEAIELNRNLMVTPFHLSDRTVELTHNLWEFYRSIIHGTDVPLETRKCSYTVFTSRPYILSWDDWMERLILCHYNKSFYWYWLQACGSG